MGTAKRWDAQLMPELADVTLDLADNCRERERGGGARERERERGATEGEEECRLWS